MTAPLNHPLPLLELDVLRTFVAIAETGSFIDAARKMNVTQSTVSARIKGLEDMLGRPLFERSKAGAELTGAGELFQKHALAMVRVWQQALWHALPVSALMLALYGYWFGIADRYRVFLYAHNGATPFDSVTGSRYWMAGLVAAGVVLVLYTGVNWLAGRAASWRGRRYALPDWRRVWILDTPISARRYPAWSAAP